MLDGYYEAFARFLRDGKPDALSGYCDADSELAFLDVYRNGFLKSCADVLRSNYPSVDQLVGKDCFGALARRHVEMRPPRVASLVTYGAGFADTIEETRGQHGLDYLPCIAKLDRAWTEVYFAGNAGAADASAVAGMTAEAIMAARGRLAPCVRLVTLEFAVIDAWACLRRGELREAMEIRRVPRTALIWRSAGDVAFRSLGGAELAFIRGIGAGQSCAEAAIAAVAMDTDFDVAGEFATVLHERILILDYEHPSGGPR